jgi:hypothetical protein
MCGARVGGPDRSGVDLAAEAVIEGTVTAAGGPVSRAYVRLLDVDGEFTAEVVTDPQGGFRLFARPGTWSLRVLAPGRQAVTRQVVATRGGVSTVAITVAD